MTKLIKPLLAKDVDENKLSFPCYTSPKIDGSFAMIQGGDLLARSLKPHENKYVTQQYSNPLFEGLRGELIVGNDPTAPDLCRNTSSALRTIEGTPETSLWCFDYVTEETKDLTYKQRSDLLIQKVVQLNEEGWDNIQYIEHILIQNTEQYIKTRDYYLSVGYEGCIIRDPSSKHKEGRSSSVKADLWRYKPWGSAELKVTKLIEEQKNNNEAKVNELGRTERSSHKENLEGKQTLGAIVGTLVTPVKDNHGKIVTEVGTELTISTGCLKDKEKKHYWDNPGEIVGSIVEFEFMSFGLKDEPRYAQFKRIRSEIDL